MRPIHRLLPLALLLAVSACASEPKGPPPGHGGRFQGGPPPHGGPPGAGHAALFISPAGEPFRAPPGAPYPVADWFAQADANHDGRLDRTEFVADAMRFFKVLDRNQDGQIDGPEVRYYENVLAPEILRGARMGAAETPLILVKYQMGGGGMGGMGGMDGPPQGGPPGGGRGRRPPGGGPGGSGGGQSLDGAAPYNLLREPQPVAAAGLTIGGRIGPADFQRRANQRFDWLDRAKAGYLELAALPKTMVQEMAAGEGGGRRRRVS